MGCDGGTIPKRGELIKAKKKVEQKDKNADMTAKWNNCAISQLPLVRPIVACELGRLYNKDAVIEFLLDKDKCDRAAAFSHIRGLKDIKELNLTDNPAFEKQQAVEKVDSSALTQMRAASYVCPVVGVELNGRYKFVLLWSCGCVFSERALKEVKGNICHKCGRLFKPEDVVMINGSPEEVEALTKRMEERRLQARQDRKGKKVLQPAAGSEAALVSMASGASHEQHLDKSSTSCVSQVSAADGEGSEAVASGATAPGEKHIDKASAGALGEDEPASKRSKLEPLAAAAAAAKPPGTSKLQLAASSGVGQKGKVAGGTSKFKSVQKDSSRSATFKSLFTTHQTALSQPKPHWVTFNPQYF